MTTNKISTSVSEGGSMSGKDTTYRVAHVGECVLTLSQRDRRFAIALLGAMANRQQQAPDLVWTTQGLQDAIDSLEMDYDGDDVEMVAAAAAVADEEVTGG